MDSRPLATIVTCTIQGLRHAPGCCQMEVSLGMEEVLLEVIGFLVVVAGMEFPRRNGTMRKIKAYFDV